MIEDTVFEFLHMETVHALVGPPDAGDDVSNINPLDCHMYNCFINLQSASITKLESVGYNTGYRFVEK